MLKYTRVEYTGLSRLGVTMKSQINFQKTTFFLKRLFISKSVILISSKLMFSDNKICNFEAKIKFLFIFFNVQVDNMSPWYCIISVKQFVITSALFYDSILCFIFISHLIDFFRIIYMLENLYGFRSTDACRIFIDLHENLHKVSI